MSEKLVEIIPGIHIKTKMEGDKEWLWDVVRTKYVVAGPEEWVRQQVVHYLLEKKNVPKALIAVEKTVQVNGLNKRFDILVYDQKTQPLLMVECKAPKIDLDEKTFEQISRYNLSLKVPYWFVTNGLKNYCCYFDEAKNQLQILAEIPQFQEMLSDVQKP